MTAHDLARAAQAAGNATRRYTPMEPYIPAVDILRRKGWSWQAIHTWLRAQGQHVQESPSTFGACMGRRYRRWLTHETSRRSPQQRAASLAPASPGGISDAGAPLAEPPAPPPHQRKENPAASSEPAAAQPGTKP